MGDRSSIQPRDRQVKRFRRWLDDDSLVAFPIVLHSRRATTDRSGSLHAAYVYTAIAKLGQAARGSARADTTGGGLSSREPARA